LIKGTSRERPAQERDAVPEAGRRLWTLPDFSRRWRSAVRQIHGVRRVLARLVPYLDERRGALAAAFAATIGYMLLRLLEPWPLKLILDNVLLGQPLPARLGFLERWADGQGELLAVLVGTIVLLALGTGFFYYWQNVLSAHLGQQVVAGMRLDLYAHLQRLDFTFHDRRRTGDLLVRLTADIRLLRDALVKIPLELSENSLLMVSMAVVMLIMDWRLGLLSMTVLPLLALLVGRYRKPMKAAIRKQRQQQGNMATTAADSLGAYRTVQGFGLEKHEVRRFGTANKKDLKQGVKAARLEAKLRWSSDLAVGLITAVVIGVAAQRILSGALLPGDIIVFMTYLRAFARPLRRVSRTTERISRTTTAGERIFEVFDTEPGVRDLPNAKRISRAQGAVSFERASLRYGRAPWSLRRVSVSVRAGERLGVVGPTGSGKSSLVSLVPRFYDATEGRVTIDGRDVRSLTLESLRRQVALVFQEPLLLATSIQDNILLGRPDASREEVMEVARRVGIHDMILGLEDGYETVVGERGGTLSGGQRQCIAIARALLKDAPIVILDEPTTGLDQRAAAFVLAALRQLMEGRTVFMISHDLDRLRDAQRIIVLEKGRLVQEGSYQELVSRAGLFRELVAQREVR
jgi:ATP-binding cassette, subfamily B, bacterial